MLYQTGNPHGGDIYEENITLDYSANTNPFGTPPGVLDAIRRALPQVRHYPDPHCRELVRAIAAFEGVPGEYVLCGNGAAELIYAYCAAVRPERGAELAPTFSEYALGLARAGGRMARYPLRPETGFELDAGFLRFLEEEKPDVVFLCNPNNPTGRTVAPGLLQEILRLCGTQGTRLFLDECFLDLSDDGVSLKTVLADHSQLFLLKAFTKSYGMAGVRLGYGLTADSGLLARMAQEVQPWNVSLLAQAAGTAALREEAFRQKTRAFIPPEREWMRTELKRLGFWVCPSQANYLLLHGAAGLGAALRKYGIAIRDCGNYVGLENGWYRVAVRLHEENVRLIAALEQIVQ